MIPTSTRVSIDAGKLVPAGADAVAVFLAAKQAKADGAGMVLTGEAQAIAALIESGVARGKAREVHVTAGQGSGRRGRRVMVAGLGPRSKVNAGTLRESAAALAKAARKSGARHVALVVPATEGSLSEAVEAIATGFLLASFRFEEYKGTVSRRKKESQEEEDEQRRVTIVVAAEEAPAARQAVARATAVAEGQNFARTIASRPGNDLNPPELAKLAQQFAREAGLDCRVLDEAQMKRLGMGGILAVGAGSSVTPPRLIVLQHRPGGVKAARGRAKAGRADRPLLIVGKAITFDTGGISIKPAEKMGRMIYDKCGGMAVLGLMYAVAKLKLPIPVVGILTSAENHISDTAYRPGDILRMYNGVTVEVTNTDAEGRLVLADALAWGIETYKPSAVLDLATLTGGVVVALGRTIAGVFSNDDGLFGELQQAADAAGEKIWRLPLGEDLREQLKSDHADIVNSAGRDGHPLQGGAFLSHFIPDEMPWAHLDIAGVADTEKELPLYCKGSTGWGVRTLVEWVTRRNGKA